ncbi:hypothetical protein ACFJGW_16885 [Burkholderiaceae bacterium UC74_6]
MSKSHLKGKRATEPNGQLIYQKAAEQHEQAAVQHRAAVGKLAIGEEDQQSSVTQRTDSSTPEVEHVF